MLYCFYFSDTEAFEACFRLLHDDDDDDTRDTCAVLRYFQLFCTATIYQYWYRRVVIDDKYRGIVSIAQH